MNSKMKVLIGVSVAGVLVLTLVVGAVGIWFVTSALVPQTALAQSNSPGSCHDNQSVFQLLGLSEQELLAQRQAGKSLLDIAKAKEVSEDKLTSALLQPMNSMHAGTQTNLDQMNQGMRDQFAKDLRESKFGTMTDYHLGLSGDGGNMMSGTNGKAMLKSWNDNSMMGNYSGNGMMGSGTGKGMMGR